MNKNKILLRLYETSNLPHSFSGVQNLLKNAKKINPSINRKDVKTFLEKQDSYTLHKITKKKKLPDVKF